ncbi:MAG: enoyl-CoA hydratase/isomerase family protein, partial [Gemmatimonadetes bacterium]|nr:enoyl-CoA hydratase/isomerase family protein [Gemmatimonadota bacterium]
MSASTSGSRAGAPGPRVKSSRDGGIVTVTLDHPGKMNVLDQAGWEALGEVFEGLAGDDSVRCVIVE